MIIGDYHNPMRKRTSSFPIPSNTAPAPRPLPAPSRGFPGDAPAWNPKHAWHRCQRRNVGKENGIWLYMVGYMSIVL